MHEQKSLADRVSRWLHRISTGPVTLIATIIFFVFAATILPAESRSAAEAGRETSPDTSFFYSTDDLYKIADAYGAQGRQLYIRSRWTFDVAFPIVYLSFLVTAISWLMQRGARPGSLWQRSNIVPVLGALFDLLENSAASLVMGRYPARTPVVDVLAPVFSALKWVFVGGGMLLLLLALVLAAAAVIRRRTGAARA
jgi:hypothetical protein